MTDVGYFRIFLWVGCIGVENDSFVMLSVFDLAEFFFACIQFPVFYKASIIIQGGIGLTFFLNLFKYAHFCQFCNFHT